MKKRSELVHTYSIIAIDKNAGVMGGAVQSHYFSVGGTVLWAESGAGVVATQAMVNIDYGPAGLSLLRNGLGAKEVIRSLTEDDDGSALRQAAVIDCSGAIAAFTGERTIRESGHLIGDGFSVQANMMLKDTVWKEMALTFEETGGELADRLIASLYAAERAGGDIRGSQSAAIVIVSIGDMGSVRGNNLIDLRVEDNSSPLDELKRLLKIQKAYAHADLGDLAMENGDFPGAAAEFRIAEELQPENLELRFWKAVSFLNNRMFEDAGNIFQPILQADKNWKELLLRLPESGVVKQEPGIIEFIKKL